MQIEMKCVVVCDKIVVNLTASVGLSWHVLMQSGLSGQESTLNTDEVLPSAMDAKHEEGSDVNEYANDEGDFEVQRMITKCFGQFENDVGDSQEDEILEDERAFMVDEGMDLVVESSIPLYEGSGECYLVSNEQ